MTAAHWLVVALASLGGVTVARWMCAAGQWCRERIERWDDG